MSAVLDLGAQGEGGRAGEPVPQPQHAQEPAAGREAERVTVDDVDVDRQRIRGADVSAVARVVRVEQLQSSERDARGHQGLATSVPGGRVEVAPNAYRKPSPIAQPSSREPKMAAAVTEPDRKPATAVAARTVIARGEIPLRPMTSATVSSATVETRTMSSGAGGRRCWPWSAWRKSSGPARIAHETDDHDGAEDGRAKGLDQLHRPTPHDEVGSDDEGQQDDPDRAEPGEQGQQPAVDR